MPEISPSRYMVQAGWDDVPHISEEVKAELLASMPPHMREARSAGVPTMGAGAIYPIPWEEVTVDPFPIPAFWKRGYGLDVGWIKTAAVWLAQDPADLTIYGYSEYSAGKKKPFEHAEAIKTRGKWIKGAVDPASRASNQKDGEKLFQLYRAAGLKIYPAINEVDAGLDHVWGLLSVGKLKFFRTLTNTAREYRNYRRKHVTTSDGLVLGSKVVKADDHNMDAMRYAVMTFDRIASVKPKDTETVKAHGRRIADKSAGY